MNKKVETIMEWEVIDINGKVLKTFPSKNQATKFKKECNAHGKYGLKVIGKETRV